MIGQKNGVAARLKEICGSVVSIWCVADRLKIVVLDSMKSILLLAELKQMINEINMNEINDNDKHYHMSAKANHELKIVADALGIHLVKPGSIDGTRWLPHTASTSGTTRPSLSILRAMQVM